MKPDDIQPAIKLLRLVLSSGRREVTHAYDTGKFVIYDLEEFESKADKILNPTGLYLVWDTDGRYTVRAARRRTK